MGGLGGKGLPLKQIVLKLAESALARDGFRALVRSEIKEGYFTRSNEVTKSA
jgi:hypothetical protein